jgi:hypothetical protein
VNLRLQIADASFHASAREVGAAPKALGFVRRKRTKAGCLLSLGGKIFKQIWDLVALYGVDLRIDLSTRGFIRNFDVCKERRIREDGSDYFKRDAGGSLGLKVNVVNFVNIFPARMARSSGGKSCVHGFCCSRPAADGVSSTERGGRLPAPNRVLSIPPAGNSTASILGGD